jgi:2-oxoglutarate ferredoxin oxidoreductase subunit gamma
MQTEIIFAGFGGQGALFAGQLAGICGSGRRERSHLDPLVRPRNARGTANCTVVVADEEIGSPLVRNPKAAIVMNLPSLDKYEPKLAPGGVLVANSSLSNR